MTKTTTAVVLLASLVSAFALSGTSLVAAQDRAGARQATDISATQPSRELAGDMKACQGTWKQTAATASGELVDKAMLNTHLRLTGDKYEILDPANDNAVIETGTFKLDDTTSPKQLTWTPTNGENKGKSTRAIYELDGDTMKYCYNQPGSPRPTEMTSTAENGNVVLTQQRLEDDDTDADAEAEAADDGM